jgi:uncharacterized membrane protein YedE/YeeE
MDAVVAIFALLAAAVIGFAVHRASLCNVRAVAELLSTRRAHMLGSFLKTVLWVIVVTFVIELVFRSGSTRSFEGWRLSARALAGGFVFGIGAAINGGCALGTLGRLGNGEARMLVTLFGLIVGLAGAAHGQARTWLPSPEAVRSARLIHPAVAMVGLAILALWVAWELWRLWRSREPRLPWRRRVLSPSYRLSTAALLLGISNGFVYSLYGPWAYTRTARATVNHLIMGRPAPETLHWLLFAALVGGVFLSGLTNGSFVLDWRLRIGWLRNLLGGLLMGVGVTMTPGGNDVLILHAIPGGSPHAVPAYAALLAGTAVALVVIRALGGTLARVECTGDVCRVKVK